MSEEALVNTGAMAWPDDFTASVMVRRMQAKLHRWAGEDPSRRFGDLFNLVYDPTLADRVVQASLKLVLEPIFEADFKPCSYGFRPNRRAQDAISEIHHLASRPSNYQWVLEADIKACFDEISHTAGQGQAGVRAGEGVPESRGTD
jgi:Reverse transcriptase (RNA-dependent DNA polymerase)